MVLTSPIWIRHKIPFSCPFAECNKHNQGSQSQSHVLNVTKQFSMVVPILLVDAALGDHKEYKSKLQPTRHPCLSRRTSLPKTPAGAVLSVCFREHNSGRKKDVKTVLVLSSCWMNIFNCWKLWRHLARKRIINDSPKFVKPHNSQHQPTKHNCF